MNKEKVLEYYESHKGEIIGAGSGLIFATLILVFGFWRMIFIILCSAGGWYLGKKAYENKNFFSELLAKIISFFKER